VSEALTIADGPRQEPPPGRRPAAAAAARPNRGRRNVLRVARVLLAVVSLVVFSATWYSWAQVEKANNGLTRSDVIDPGAKTNTGPENILLVGIDTRVDAQGNPLPQAVLNQLHAGSGADGADATDSIIIIHIPAGGGRAIGFSVPRDSYVQLTGGYGTHKINSAYTYAETAALKQLRNQGLSGSQLWVQAAQAGAKNSIQTIEQFTGLSINHYAAVNLVGFYDISQAIGGVQVCLNHATKDKNSGANFPAGLQTISGVQALAFVRQRDNLPLGDLDRIRRQQVFMAAMAKAVLSSGTLTSPSKLDSLIAAIQKSITLDQNWDILSFAQQLQGISGGNIQFLTVPIVNITYPTPHDGDAVEVNPQQVRTFIQQQVSASDAAAAPTTTSNAAAVTTTTASPPPPSTSTNAVVDVYNANGTSGLAGRVLTLLGDSGFTKGDSTTSASRSASVIEYGSGSQSAAQGVATALGGGITIEADSAVSAGHVRVYLGKDYRGPSTSGTTASTPTTTIAPAEPAVTGNGVPCIN
jgi:LCP family protein required for cell wall assembly